MSQSERVGLMIGRIQPLTLGHCKVITRMNIECHRTIFCLGSCNEPFEPTELNPFPADVRQEFLNKVFGKTISVIRLHDIGADTKEAWLEYVLDRIKKANLPEPTDYYTGCVDDSLYYDHHFTDMVESMPGQFDTDETVAEPRLHICRRDLDGISGTGVRKFIHLRDDRWKLHVPKTIHRLVEKYYPASFRMPIQAEDFDDTLPEGTKVLRFDMSPAMLFQRKNGQWVSLRESRTNFVD